MRGLSLLLLAACAHRPAPAPPAPPAAPVPRLDAATCEALLDDSLLLMDREPVEADRAYARGYEACGPGFGFLEARTYVAFNQSRWDDGGELLLQAMSESGPTLLTVKLVVGGMTQFSAPMQARFRALGHSPATPVYVPDIGAEYAWVALVNCGVQARVPANQALVAGPNGSLDQLTFTCPGAAASDTVYFDYSADPMERAFLEQLKAAEAAAQGSPTP